MNDEENQKSTSFEDLMNRTEEIESIIKVIEGEYTDEEDDSYVFAINGEYGSGKTKFLELFEEEIKKNQSDRVLKINAWRDSFANDPLLSICYGFYEYFKNLKKKSSSKKWDKTISTINKCGKFAVFAGNATLAGAPSAGFDAISEGSDTKIFENFRSLRSSLADVKESLEKYVKQKNKKPTYILVDELDRCSPKYAVKFLEAIHHFFCVEGLVFVIAIDQSQLRSYVEKIYGVNNDRFDGWYAKFIKASYNLQSVWDKIKKVRCPSYHIANLRPIFFDIGMKKPLEDKDILYITIQLHNIIPELRNCHKNTFSNPHYLVSKILESFNLPLRQINLFIKNLKRWYIHNQINSYIRNDAELEIAAFLIALKLKNSTDYNKVINTLSSGKKYNTASIEEIINKKLGKHNTFALSCVKIRGGKPNELYDELIALELYRTIPGHYDDENHRLLLFSKREGSSYYDVPLYQCAALEIHKEIEEMKDFG